MNELALTVGNTYLFNDKEYRSLGQILEPMTVLNITEKTIKLEYKHYEGATKVKYYLLEDFARRYEVVEKI